ncbi:MAG TPA: cupin domain-containing protein [Anaerolineae bacterium]|jgi:transcriptional regulator with XRE-family HTH domain|nr:cupin domain-containing protein [Anaerolineae bacterium]
MNELEGHEDETAINLGNQLRTLRDQRRLSQQELAKASGISRNTLSLIERGQTSPTVSTLKSLAMALSVEINAFFQPYEETGVVFTKADLRPYLLLDHGTLADLGLGILDPLVTPLLFHLEPGARSGPALTHDGQDFVFCLSGEILYSVSGRGYILEPGDSLFFDGRLPHRFRNTAMEDSSLLIILSTPHDGAQYIASHFPENTQD